MKRLRSNRNPCEPSTDDISCELGNASPAKTGVVRLLKQNQVRESALLGPQVKLRTDWKHDRWGQVSSCHIGSLQSFHTSGLPPINTPPPPSLAGGCSKIDSQQRKEREQPPPKHITNPTEAYHKPIHRS